MDMDCLSLWSKYVHKRETEGFFFRQAVNILILWLVCVVIVCADETLSLCVAELGRDALSVQAAPHDPGASLQ